MKNTQKFIYSSLFPLFAMTLCVLLPSGKAMATSSSSSSADDTTVSVVSPVAPSEGGDAVTPVVPEKTSDTDKTPDGFPPQPVSVAPAEDVSTSPSSPSSGAMPVPAGASASTATPSAVTDMTAEIKPATTPVPAASVAAPVPPPEKDLSTATPMPATPSATATTGTDGSASSPNVMGDSGAKTKNSGKYYDSNAVVPDKDLNKAPRRLDPTVEPAGKYVVVEKTGSATSYEAQYVAASRALKLARYPAAMEMFEKLYKKNHRDPRILMGLAVAQQGAGFNQSAATTYEDLLKVDPNNSDAIVNLMGIMKNQYPAVTLQRLGELRGKYPTNPGIPAQIGLLNADMKHYDEALKNLEIAASMDPRNPSHMYNMAIVADRKGDVKNAITFYERALELDASYGDTASGLSRETIYDRLAVLRRKV